MQSHNLKNVQVEEVSLVDQGANQHAYIKLYKNGGKMDIEQLAKRLEEVEAQNQVLTTLSKMNDAEKAYMDGMDEDAKKRFMDMKPEERKKLMEKGKMEKSAAMIEIEKRLYEEQEIRKALADKIQKMQDENEMLKLEKRAEKELAGIPGTPSQKAVILKAIDGISHEDIRRIAFESISRANERNVSVTKEYGASGSNDDPAGKLEALAKNYAKEHGVSVPIAYSKVLDTEEGRELRKQEKQNRG